EDIRDRFSAAYEAFDHSAGDRLRTGRSKKHHSPLDTSGGTFRGGAVLNAAELAALWHLPDLTSGLPVATQPGRRRLLPADRATGRGSRVGMSRHHGQSVPVHLPHGALYRNHLVVAKTRRGKSTLLQHVAGHLMQEIASRRERLLLVV